VPLADILNGVTRNLAGKTQEQQELLERRAADKELRDELASAEFTGPKYQMFQEELARYGMSVLSSWMYTGYIFQFTAARGFRLYPTEVELEDLHRQQEIRDELAGMTVAMALPRFRDRALAGGGWRPEGGASLATYFMGACVYVFPNEFRKRRVQQEKWRRQDSRDSAVDEDPGEMVNDPGVIVVGARRVCEDLARASSREAAIVALTIDGYSQEEIVEALGETSTRAVEGALYRWRTKEQRRLKGGTQP
jgi:DNA-directed RNA polymerase specialized sigma24 family protein